MDMTRHVGKCNDKRCVLVLQLPEDTDEVFVIDTESLPDIYHDFLLKAVNSPEAQNSVWLGSVLSRKTMGAGKNALAAFFETGYVKKVPVSSVVMTPRPNMVVPLETVIDGMRNSESAAPTNETVAEGDTTPPVKDVDPSLVAETELDNSVVAQGLLVEADVLEKQAAAKRQEAYALDPSLTVVDNVAARVDDSVVVADKSTDDEEVADPTKED